MSHTLSHLDGENGRHFLIKCGTCDVVLMQCRCFSRERQVIVSKCRACLDKEGSA